MNASKEILLLSDAFCSNHDEQIVIKLIKDVCEGLDTPHSETEKEFWKHQVSFYLTQKVLPSSAFEDSFALWPVVCLKPISWQCFFSICLQSSIFDGFVSFMLTLLPDEDIFIIIDHYCEEIKKTPLFHDYFMSMCVLIAYFLQYSNVKLTKTCCAKLNETIQEYENILERDKSVFNYHLSGINGALNALRKHLPSQNSEIMSLDITSLNKIKNLSFLNQLTVQDFQQKMEFLKGFVEQDFISKEVERSTAFNCDGAIKKLVLDFKTLFARKSSNGKDDITNDTKQYVVCFNLFLKELNSLFSDCTESVTGEDKDTCTTEVLLKWDVTTALYCATNLCDQYNDATSYLLDCMNDKDNNTLENVENCVTAFMQHPQCLYHTDHVVKLYEVIVLLHSKLSERNVHYEKTKTCLKHVNKLFSECYSHLPLKSRMYLLECRCKRSFKVKEDHLAFCKAELFPYMTSEEKNRKINIVFNKLTNSDQHCAMDHLLSAIANVAFLDPIAILNKIVDQVISHKEHQTVLLTIFSHFPCLVLIKDQYNKNAFLNCLCIIARENNDDDTTKNICSFLSSMLKSTDFDDVLLHTLVDILFSDYILPSLSYLHNQKLSPSHVPIGISLVFKDCISVNSLLEYLNHFDKFCLLYLLLRIVDLYNLEDQLRAKVKNDVVHIVELVGKEILEDNTDIRYAYQWLKHVSSSLHWTNQLYLQPILSKVNGHRTMLPASIKDVCDIHDVDSFEFIDSYGKGTGLTAWLQCLIIEPGLFPVSCLSVQNLIPSEQEIFSHGMVIALSQVLPMYGEEDWHIIFEAVKALLCCGSLRFSFPINPVLTLKRFHAEQYEVSLSIMELLSRISIILGSSCCSEWMTECMWKRFSKCYAVIVKQIIIENIQNNFGELDDLYGELLVLSQLFFHSCNLLTHSNFSSVSDSIFVLLLEILTVFSTKVSEISVQCDLSTEGTTAPPHVKDDILNLQTVMLSQMKAVNNEEMKSALAKKLLSLSIC